jgi:hypothetical protein
MHSMTGVPSARLPTFDLLPTPPVEANGPLEEISKEDRASDLKEALTFGNHKGASSKRTP